MANEDYLGQRESAWRNYQNYQIDDGVPSAFETLRRFHDSGINSFLSIYEETVQPQASRMVLMCIAGHCGGIGDRIRGIPYAVALAHICSRQLILHPSLLSNGPFFKNLTSENHYSLLNEEGCTTGNVESLRKSTAETLFISVNCWGALDPYTFVLHQTQIDTLQIIQKECSLPHLCGAAVIHQANAFKDGIDTARHIVAGLPMLEYRNYTALHVRAGGSKLLIDGSYTTKAVAWNDGYASDIPQHWIDAFNEKAPFTSCQKHLAIVSDSARLVSELQFAAGERLMITRCCSQPLHRDQAHRQEFFLQEIIDLFVMARSRKLIAGHGGFAILGRYWLGRDGPEMKVAMNKEEIQSQMESIWQGNDCAVLGGSI
jgi:hypothetical protein